MLCISSSIIVQDEASREGIESILKEYLGKNRKRKAVVENEISILKSYKLSRMAIEELEEFNITYIGHGLEPMSATSAFKSLWRSEPKGYGAPTGI